MTDPKKTVKGTSEVATASDSELANVEVSTFLQENAGLGMEEVDTSDIRMPTLILLQSNSTAEDDKGNLLGSDHKGEFYYRGTKSVYDNPEVIILAFSKKNLPTYDDKTKTEPNYVIMGMFLETKLPFLMYCRSYAIGAVKDLLSQASMMRRPLWSFTTILTSEAAKIEKDGKKFNFYKVRFTAHNMINDRQQLLELKEMTEKYKGVLGIVKGEAEEEIPPAEDLLAGTEYEEHNKLPDVNSPDRPENSHKEEVNPDDVPF